MKNVKLFTDKLLIAIAALVQVWVIAAWKKWIAKGKLEFHPAANIEIGFSPFGSTISLPGTLRALTKDVFVSEMYVKIARLSDLTIHNFSWRLFKSNTFSATSLAPEHVEMATSFTLPISTPRPIFTFFSSVDFATRYADQAEKVKTEWQFFLVKKSIEPGHKLALAAKVPGFIDMTFMEFSKSKIPSDLSKQMKDDSYWQVGKYRMDFEIRCAPPTKTAKYSWLFELTQNDVNKLRSNVIPMMKEICEIKVKYNFIYKAYDAIS